MGDWNAIIIRNKSTGVRYMECIGEETDYKNGGKMIGFSLTSYPITRFGFKNRKT